MLQKEQQHEHGSAMAEEKNHRSSSGIGRRNFPWRPKAIQ
jgi:hypothetical protein